MANVLPRHIADLVGIVFNEPRQKPAPSPHKTLQSVIKIVEGDDGTLTLMRLKKTVGWMYPVRLAGDRTGYRAVSVHGQVKNCYSLASAKNFLFSSYH